MPQFQPFNYFIKGLIKKNANFRVYYGNYANSNVPILDIYALLSDTNEYSFCKYSFCKYAFGLPFALSFQCTFSFSLMLEDEAQLGDKKKLKNSSPRTLVNFAIIIFGLILSSSSVFAQGVVRSQHGDWQMSCDTPPGASLEQCAIIQNITAENQPNVGLSVIVLKTADQQARLLRVLVPLGVLLPNGLGLNVDGQDMGRVAFVRCLPNGCIAEVIMDDALIEVLSTGTNAIFVVFKTPEEGIGIPVSLNGFADGFAALP